MKAVTFGVVALLTVSLVDASAVTVPLAPSARMATVADGGVDLAAAEQVRADQCLLGQVLHLGGPAMKVTAQGGLTGSDAELHHAASQEGWTDTPLKVAFQQDRNAYNAKMQELNNRHEAWRKPVLSLPNPGFQYLDEFAKVPDFHRDLGGFYAHWWWGDEGRFYADPAAKAGQASIDAASQLAASLYPTVTSENVYDSQAWDDIKWNKFRADDVRLFLQAGGFPKAAPALDSMESRIDVEALKVRFASCTATNPHDPHHVLDAEVTAAATEWKAELDGQAAQRAAIVAAEAQASADLASAAQAMVEAVGQSWIAGRLVYWQAYFVNPPENTHEYPTPVQSAQAKQEIANAQTRAAGQVIIANRAAQSAQAQADKVTAAQNQALAIADAAGVPRGRGLLYAQQSAQVAKAAAAAAQAAAKATLTAAHATRAAAADSQAQIALAQTQAHASEAEFRRAAAQEAAAQAKYAAEGAAAQAAQAAQAATRAKAAQATAQAAEKTAHDAAGDAHAKRAIAEQERANAAAARRRADAERAKAKDAEARAQTQQANAATARQAAEAAGQVAHTKAVAADEAEAQARQGRDAAIAAEQHRDAMTARAAAAEAAAAATDASQDAGAARQAANDARSAADDATTAAQNARGAANDATNAAVAARAAATEATGAAQRSKAAADAARADADTTRAAAATAHAAAADAIKASEDAAQNVKNAEALAQQAAAQAAKARQDAATAQVEAGRAAADSIRTAGFAYATAQAAIAARDCAVTVADPANTAIEVGTPYKDSDASAGLAVLTGQNAKTVAEQQAAAAQARADQAAKAAATAKAAAAKASQDAKAAADAAAQAADQAARAAQSLAQARASAAEAATAAAAAQRADANAAEYDRQAHADADAATGAANDADADATAARTAATDAERDAASARGAATTAEHDASVARDTAAQANRDATAAEKAAANAKVDAQQAQDTASRAEADANAHTKATALTDTGPAGAGGVEAVPDVHDDIPKNVNCVQTDPTHCRLDVPHHITGQIVYLLHTCPDAATTYCPGTETTNYLGSVPVNITITKTIIVNYWDITEALWKNLAYGMVSDFVGCARDKKAGDCAWAAATLLAPTALKVAARSAIALRVALRTGTGIEEALVALRTTDLEGTALFKLEEEADEVVAGKCIAVGHSFDGHTPVVMADGRRKAISEVRVGDTVRTTDADTGSTVIGTVTHLFRNRDTDLTDVAVRTDGGHMATVHTTQHHRFWDETRHVWTEAAVLTPGSQLHALGGEKVVVVGVKSFVGSQDMYDLTVTGVHTYYVVVGETPVLVHNASCVEYANYYGGSAGGVLARLDEGGVASFAIEKGPTTPNGGQMFDDAMNHFGVDNVKAIEGKWVTAMPSNLNTFNRLTAEGVAPAEAAAQTFTGKMAARYGFTRAEVKLLKGSPGNYTNVELVFVK